MIFSGGRIALWCFLLFLLPIYAVSQTVIYTLDFESAGGYTTSISEFTDGGTDYFIRTDGSNITGESFTNIQGSNWYGAQDIDGEGATLPVYLNINNVDITGYTNLQLRVYLAEDDDGSNQDWDASDYVHFDYDINNSGSWSNALWIENDGSTFNSAPFIDTDFDGVGDGAEITDAFTQYSVGLTGTGTDLDIRITFQLDSGDEDIAIDHIEIVGDGSTPTLTVTPATLTGFSYILSNGPSSAQTFTLEASNLSPATGDLSITGSTNYEVSTDGTTFSGSLTVPYSGGALAVTTIYVRLEAGLAAGTYNGQQITISGGGATAVQVTCDGEVTEPTLSLSTDSLNLFSYLIGNGPSSNRTFTVSGSSLTPAAGNITVFGATNYEVSTDGVSFSASVTLPYTSNNLGSTTIYVRLEAGLTANTYYGQAVSVSGGGATSQDVICDGIVRTSAPLFINEVSNGTSGNQEYIELVVDGGSCATVDLRGIILDDNNGLDNGTCEGFATTSTAAGVATGHYRFANIPQWAAVPSKSIIVLYVNTDRNPLIPADDIDDTSPHDSVYIVPLMSTALDRMAGFPTSSPADCGYTSGAYENPPTSDQSMIFANGGDAAQVRYDDGSYMHGISYGPSPITGGPESLLLSTSNGGGRVYYFNDVDPHVGSNWTVGSAGADETPGAANNPTNAAFIAGIGCPFLLSIPENWKADCDGQMLTLSVTDKQPDRTQCIEVMDEAGEKSKLWLTYDAWIKGYRLSLQPQWQYWRWADQDDNGAWQFGNWQSITCQSAQPNVVLRGGQLVNLTAQSSLLQLYNAVGQVVASGTTPLDVSHLPAGWYLSVQGHNRQPMYLAP